MIWWPGSPAPTRVMILRNPFDITNIPSPEGQHAVMRSLAASERFDMLVAQVSISNSGWPFVESPFRFWPGHVPGRAPQGAPGGKANPSPSYCTVSPTRVSSRDCVPLRQKCQAAGLPVYDSIPRAALAMDRFMRYHEKR